MLYIEAGLFFLVLGFAIFFTLFAFRGGTQNSTTAPTNAAFRLLAMALFLGLAGTIAAGYPVSMTQTSSQTIRNPATNETWVENDTNHNVVIPGGLDSYWLAWIFGAFGFMNLVFLVREFAFQ